MAEIQVYPRMLYRGKAQLEAAENAGAEEHLIVHSFEEEQKALAEGYRLQPEESEPKPKPDKASKAKPEKADKQ